uniref:Uncharacterized protein n=1 Tax=Arundo donax TaxID=35708 RepID=A0A0A9FUG4_ARUDO
MDTSTVQRPRTPSTRYTWCCCCYLTAPWYYFYMVMRRGREG